MRSFQATGIWWSPEHPSKTVAGTLHFSDEEGLYLALIGTLSDAQRLTREKRPVILGSVFDLPGGQQITLRDCQQRRLSMGAPGFSREEYLVNRAFLGGHLETDTAFKFRGTQLKLCGLPEWAEGFTGIHFPLMPTKNEPYQLMYTRPESLIAQVPGGQVTLGVYPSVTHTARRCVLEEDLAFDIECEEPRSDIDFNTRYVYPLQNFVTLAGGRPAAVREFSVLPDRAAGESNAPLRLQVAGPRVFSEERYDAEKITSFPLFLLPDVKMRFAEVIRRWLQISDKFADTCNLYFGIQYMRKSYLDTRLLAVVQSLELYQAHREGSGERQKQEGQRYKRVLNGLAEDREWLRLRLGPQPHVPFSETLAALVDEHGVVLDPLYGGDRNGFVAAACAAYDYILHRRLVAEKAPQSDEDLYWLMERLRIVMKDCFLSELEFATEERNRIFNTNRLYQHLRGLGWQST
jgi:hypothetical protein